MAAAPTIEYSTPSPVRNEDATLRFSIDPEGLETNYEVEIARVGQSLKSWGMPRFTAAGEDPIALEVKVPRYFEGSLAPGTEYRWRVTAWNDDGKTVGPEQLFTTTDGPTPAFTTGTASQTGTGGVSFTGAADPQGASLTDCRFRWVDKTIFTNAGFEKWAAVEMVRFGETVSCSESAVEIGSGSEPVSVSGEANDLEPGEYVFRIEGENAFGGFAAGQGVPFVVPANIDPSEAELHAPFSGPLIPLAGQPARKFCPRAHRKGPPTKAKGKKHSHAKKHGRGRSCARRNG